MIPISRANELSRVLPEAIIKRSSRDDSLVTALTPTVEKSVRFSIKGNLKAFADALFPVMGPAIRKAISEALRNNDGVSQSCTRQELFNAGHQMEVGSVKIKKALL